MMTSLVPQICQIALSSRTGNRPSRQGEQLAVYGITVPLCFAPSMSCTRVPGVGDPALAVLRAVAVRAVLVGVIFLCLFFEGRCGGFQRRDCPPRQVGGIDLSPGRRYRAGRCGHFLGCLGVALRRARGQLPDMAVVSVGRFPRTRALLGRQHAVTRARGGTCAGAGGAASRLARWTTLPTSAPPLGELGGTHLRITRPCGADHRHRRRSVSTAAMTEDHQHRVLPRTLLLGRRRTDT